MQLYGVRYQGPWTIALPAWWLMLKRSKRPTSWMGSLYVTNRDSGGCISAPAAATSEWDNNEHINFHLNGGAFWSAPPPPPPLWELQKMERTLRWSHRSGTAFPYWISIDVKWWCNLLLYIFWKNPLHCISFLTPSKLRSLERKALFSLNGPYPSSGPVMNAQACDVAAGDLFLFFSLDACFRCTFIGNQRVSIPTWFNDTRMWYGMIADTAHTFYRLLQLLLFLSLLVFSSWEYCLANGWTTVLTYFDVFHGRKILLIWFILANLSSTVTLSSISTIKHFFGRSFQSHRGSWRSEWQLQITCSYPKNHYHQAGSGTCLGQIIYWDWQKES